MPRIKRTVDKDKLQNLINLAEKNGPLENRSFLWARVAEFPYAKENGITGSVAYLRFREFGLTCKTPMGKAGRSKASEDTEETPEPTTKAKPARTAKVEPDAVTPPMPARQEKQKPCEPGKISINKDFFEPFTKRGLNITRLEDLTASVKKTDEENIAIWEGWQEVIMRTYGAVPNKNELIAMYNRLGRPVPHSITRLIDRTKDGADLNLGDTGMRLNPRIEMVK